MGAKKLGFVLLALVAWSGAAHAAFLPVGGTLAPTPIEPDPLGGLILVNTTGPAAFAGTNFNGTLNTTVYKNDASNPFGLNALTFTYELHNNAVGSTNV